MLTAPPAHPGGAFDLDDLERTPEDGNRYEVLDGALVVSPSPSPLHQRAVGRLYRLLDAGCPPQLEVFVAPLAWRIGPGQIPEPDLMVVDRTAVGTRAVENTPRLVVEVLSPLGRGRDLHEKRRLYAEAGCPWYWILDPEEPSLVVLRLGGGAYSNIARVDGGRAWSTAEPITVRVVPADLVR